MVLILIAIVLLPQICCCCLAAKSCPTLWDPMDCNTSGFLSFSISWSLLKLMSIVLVILSNHLRLALPTVYCALHDQWCLTLCDTRDSSLLGSSVHGISRQEYWSGLPFCPPGDLPDSDWIMSSVVPTLAGRLFTAEHLGFKYIK